MTPERVAELLGERPIRIGVTVTISREHTSPDKTKWRRSRSLPYFELNANVQGILTDSPGADETVNKIVRSIVDPFGEESPEDIHVSWDRL